jgi:hypothetical protein
MNARMLKDLTYTAAYSLLIFTFLITSVPAAQAETLLLFRSPETAAPGPNGIPRDIQEKNFLKLGEKGDLLIQCGSARFTIASNAPVNQFKPSGQQYNPQREFNTPIIGVSLTASISF